MDTYTIIIAIIAFILSFVLFYKRDRKYKLPPGPRAFPIIGTMYDTSIISFHKMTSLRKSYGDIALFYAGPIRMVLLNSLELCKDTFVNNAKVLSDRGIRKSLSAHTLNPHEKGLLDNDYTTELRENRSHSLTIMRNLGVGRSTMEERILEEASTLVDVITSENGKAFNPFSTLSQSVANVILSVVLSKRYEHNDPELLGIIQLADDEIACGTDSFLIDSLNFLRFIPPFSRSFKRMVECDQGMIDYMWKYAKQHMMENDGQDTDFVYGWINKNSSKQKESPGALDEENLKYILRDLILAGTETTATSLKWTILHLTNNPDIQTKLHKEIDDSIGMDRAIRLADRDQLPYLEALILEIERFNTVAPIALPHTTYVDTKIGDFDIPADTAVCSNLAAIHYDEATFKDPYAFRPERFIDSDGKFIKHPNVVPFGIGKRSCIGELLARQELFLFTAALVQHFRFLPPEGVEKIDEEGIFNFTYGPKKYKVRAEPR